MTAGASMSLQTSLKAAGQDVAANEGVSPTQLIALAPAEMVGAAGSAAHIVASGVEARPERAARRSGIERKSW